MCNFWKKIFFSFPNLCLSLLRIFIFFMLSCVVLCGNYLILNQTWYPVAKTDTFLLHNCENLNITREKISNVKWEDVLKDANYIEYNFINENNTLIDLTFYISEIFYIIPKDVFRSLTFGLINLNPYEITLKSYCNVNASLILNMFDEVGRSGIVIETFNNTDTIYASKTLLINDAFIMSLLLFIVNGVAGLCLTSYFCYYGYHKLIKEWNTAVKKLGKKYYKDAYEKGDLMEHKIEACGPFFLLEHIYGNPEKNRIKNKYGIISSIIHVIFFNLLLTPLVFNIYFTDISFISEITYLFLCSYQLIVFIYSIFYYLNMKWAYRKKIAYLMYFYLSLILFLSCVYLVNCLLWFIFSLSVSPIRVASILVMVSTYFYYIIYTYSQLKTYQKIISSKFENENIEINQNGGEGGDEIESVIVSDCSDSDEEINKLEKLESQKEKPRCKEMLKNCKLTNRDIYVKLLTGTLMVTLLAVWVILIWLLIGLKYNDISSLLTVLIVPFGAIYNKFKSLKDIKEKMENNGIEKMNLFIDNSRKQKYLADK